MKKKPDVVSEREVDELRQRFEDLRVLRRKMRNRDLREALSFMLILIFALIGVLWVGSNVFEIARWFN